MIWSRFFMQYETRENVILDIPLKPQQYCVQNIWNRVCHLFEKYSLIRCSCEIIKVNYWGSESNVLTNKGPIITGQSLKILQLPFIMRKNIISRISEWTAACKTYSQRFYSNSNTAEQTYFIVTTKSFLLIFKYRQWYPYMYTTNEENCPGFNDILQLGI